MNTIERSLSNQVKHPQALIDLLAVIGIRAEICLFLVDANNDRKIPAIALQSASQSMVISIPSIFSDLPVFEMWTDESFSWSGNLVSSMIFRSLSDLIEYISSVD